MSDVGYVPPKKSKSEWSRFGDPRCGDGHYRPKANLARWLRENHDWSQKRLARKVGTDGSTLSKWIAGTRYLTDAKLAQIALALHVSIPFLLDQRKYGGEYATSTNTTFGPKMAQIRSELEKNRILYELYWELLDLEKGELMTVPIGPPEEDAYVTDISYYDHVYPSPAYCDVDFDDYDRPYEIPYFYSEAIKRMERDDYDYPGDYRDPNHLLEALVKEYVRQGWGPSTLDRIGSLIP